MGACICKDTDRVQAEWISLTWHDLDIMCYRACFCVVLFCVSILSIFPFPYRRLTIESPSTILLANFGKIHNIDP